jgi:uncharacterized protein
MVFLIPMTPESQQDGSAPSIDGIPAGEFSAWLRHARKALALGLGTDVDCGDCAACCSSSYFIHVKPEEAKALGPQAQGALAAAPGMPKGHKVLAYDKRGVCPMLKPSGCSVYAKRPQTCRSYDCRIFAAAGIPAGGHDKAGINTRVERWIFAYPAERDREEHAAVRAAAAFIRDKAASFPGGRVPGDPSQLAVLALKAYAVFLMGKGASSNGSGHASGGRSDGETAAAIVAACRDFDGGKTGA